MRGYTAIALLLHHAYARACVRLHASIDRFLRKRINATPRREADHPESQRIVHAAQASRTSDARHNNALSCITRDNYVIGDNLSALSLKRGT